MANQSGTTALTTDPVFQVIEQPDELIVIIEDESRHLPGKHNQKDHGRNSGGSIVKGKDQTEWAAGLTRDGYANNDLTASTDFSDPRDRALIGIAKQQGFDGKPTKGSIEDTVKNGGVEIHRGVVPHKGTGKSGEDLINDFKDGPYEPGTGIYGNGFYFSSSARVADHYAKGSPVRKNSKPTPGGKSFKAALKPDAKVISDEELRTEMKAWQKQVKPKTQDIGDLYKNDFKTPADQYSPHFTEYVMGDPGRFAAAKGYDAIKITGKQDGAPVVKGEPKAKTSEGKFFSANDQYLVLNRTAVVVEEA